MGARALKAAVAILVAGLALGQARAEPDPFPAMNALRATPPVPVPAVMFKGLDGRPARLEVFRGRTVLLTFFTTW